jgi:5-methylcytosine-specific restriction endonuclease McrA
MKKWERFTRQEIEEFVKGSLSYAELAKKCGYSPTGGSSTKQIQQMIDQLCLDTSHFTGQGWNKNNFDYSRFRYGNNIKTNAALPAITAIRGHKCEKCGLSEWLNETIALEIHHKDGNALNNTLDNLELLCPNCHALTENYRGRNINHTAAHTTEEEFVTALKNSSSIRQALITIGLTPKGGNYARANELIHKYQIKNFL